jgi:hypothetical protein
VIYAVAVEQTRARHREKFGKLLAEDEVIQKVGGVA